MFTSVEEVKAYLQGDRITCLECGKKLKKIAGNHLKTHNMSDDDYREKYGIPWSYPLTCSETSEKYSKNRREFLEKPGELDKLLERRKIADKLKNVTKRPQLDIVKKYRIQDQMWPESYAQIIIDRIKGGQSLVEVCEDPSLPGKTWMVDRISKDPTLKAAYYRAMESWDFKTQAAHKQIGKKFEKEVVMLQSEGLTVTEISDLLQVSKTPIHKVFRKHKLDSNYDPKTEWVNQYDSGS